MKLHLTTPARRLRHATTVLLAAALAACTAEQSVAAPDMLAATAKASSNKSALDAFVEAQGTWCDPNYPGECEAQEQVGLGFFLVWCADGACVEPLGMGVDFGGVNARWWEREGHPSLPAYGTTGSVNETITRDGRRRLVINIRARNTFTTLIDLSNGTFVLGSAFEELPGRPPELGESTISADVTLPAGFVGMPDLYQILFDQELTFDIAKLVLTSSGTGTLRRELRGIAAGTRVAVNGDFHEMVGSKVSAERQKFYRNPRSSGLGGAARITIRPLN